MNKIRMKASLTIEASLVMIAVVLVIASTVTMALSLRDKVAVAADLRLNAEVHTIYGELAERESEDIVLLYGRMLLYEYFDTDQITERMYGEVKGIWPLNLLAYEEVLIRNVYNPPTFLRMMNIIEEVR